MKNKSLCACALLSVLSILLIISGGKTYAGVESELLPIDRLFSAKDTVEFNNFKNQFATQYDYLHRLGEIADAYQARKYSAESRDKLLPMCKEWLKNVDSVSYQRVLAAESLLCYEQLTANADQPVAIDKLQTIVSNCLEVINNTDYDKSLPTTFRLPGTSLVDRQNRLMYQLHKDIKREVYLSEGRVELRHLIYILIHDERYSHIVKKMLDDKGPKYAGAMAIINNDRKQKSGAALLKRLLFEQKDLKERQRIVAYDEKLLTSLGAQAALRRMRE